MSMIQAPYTFLREGEGKSFWVMGTLMTIKASLETTGNGYAFTERLARPGYGQPAHVHRLEDETIILLEGKITGTCGDQQWEATPGSFVFLPRGIAHSFQIQGPNPAHLYMIFSPAGFERLYEELGVPAKELTLPPAEGFDPLLTARMLALSAKYQLEFQGPLALLEDVASVFV